MMNTTFLKKLTVVLVALFFASCDKDYTGLGADIVGNENFDFGPGKQFGVKAYNQIVPTVQTNNLSLNQLGVYETAAFGTTTASFVTQLSLTALKPTFTSGVEVDSVLLSVPYLTTKIATDADGKGTYKQEFVHGTGSINLEVYRNGVYLRDYSLESNLSIAEKYYSDEENTRSNFNGNKLPLTGKLNNGTPEENTAFFPDMREYIRFKPKADLTPGPREIPNIESRNAPRMSLHLDKDYFKTEILDKASNPLTEGNFVNNNVFRSFFEGIYFKVVSGAPGRLMTLDFSKGDVTIYYKQDKVAGNSAVKEMKSLVMTMTGNTVNLFNNTPSSEYATAMASPDRINGDKDIYLKGGQGSTAYIELFNGTELQDLRNSNILVNDASLTFTVNTDPTSYNRPLRIYVFDADTNKPVLDYFYDSSTNTSDSKLNKSVYGGVIQEVKQNVDGQDIIKYKYRIRITEHVSNIIKNTAEKNVRLGVVVTENINLATYAALKNEISDPDPLIPGSTRVFSKLPVASVMNPLGVKLFGTHPDVPNHQKIKFEIFYTKPN